MARFVRFSRRRGVALLAIVLVGFVVLSIVAAVAMNIAGQSTRIEAQQTQNIQKRRLDALARSAAVAVAEAISADQTLRNFQDAANVDVTSDKQLIFSDPKNTYLTLSLKGASSIDYTITATATASSDRSGASDDKAELTYRVESKDGKLVRTWGKGQ